MKMSLTKLRIEIKKLCDLSYKRILRKLSKKIEKENKIGVIPNFLNSEFSRKRNFETARVMKN